MYRGKLIEAEDNMNSQMASVTVTYRDGRVAQLEHIYIRGSKIRFMILPDMLKNAPMLKNMGGRGGGRGGGGAPRGKSGILRAQAGAGKMELKYFCLTIFIFNISCLQAGVAAEDAAGAEDSVKGVAGEVSEVAGTGEAAVGLEVVAAATKKLRGNRDEAIKVFVVTSTSDFVLCVFSIPFVPLLCYGTNE